MGIAVPLVFAFSLYCCCKISHLLYTWPRNIRRFIHAWPNIICNSFNSIVSSSWLQRWNMRFRQNETSKWVTMEWLALTSGYNTHKPNNAILRCNTNSCPMQPAYVMLCTTIVCATTYGTVCRDRCNRVLIVQFKETLKSQIKQCFFPFFDCYSRWSFGCGCGQCHYRFREIANIYWIADE